MKELVEVIAKSLVDHPDEVLVTETEENDAVLIELKVAPADMGKVIGSSSSSLSIRAGLPKRSVLW